MNKKVREVFFNCLSDLNSNFADANISEIKFSKKLNATIISTNSKSPIPLSTIEEFERRACKEYELNSFRVDHEYIGECIDINETNIRDILVFMMKKYDYTKQVFQNCKIDVDNDTRNITITLSKKFANFVHMKKLDEYIKKCIDTEFGKAYSINIKDDENIKEEEFKPLMIKLEDLASFSQSPSIGDGTKNSTAQTQNSKFSHPVRPKLTEEEKEERKLAKEPQPENVIYGINIQTQEREKVCDLIESEKRVCIEGELFQKDERELKSG